MSIYKFFEVKKRESCRQVTVGFVDWDDQKKTVGFQYWQQTVAHCLNGSQ